MGLSKASIIPKSRLKENHKPPSWIRGAKEIKIETIDQKVKVYVTDTGKGIRSDYIPHLFKQWYSSKDGEGHGHGLWLVNKYLEHYGGFIEVVASEINKGTTMMFCLPISQQGSNSQ